MVANPYMVVNGFCPEILWQASCVHHSLSTFDMGMICSFSSTIRSRRVMDSEVADSSRVFEVFSELITHEFTSSITTENLDWNCSPPLNLKPCLVLLIVREGLRLLPQEVNLLLVAMQILKKQIVSLPCYQLNCGWSPDIGYNFIAMPCTRSCSPLEMVCM